MIGSYTYSIVMLCPEVVVPQVQAFALSIPAPIAMGFEAVRLDGEGGTWRGFETAARATVAALAQASPEDLFAAIGPAAVDANDEFWTLAKVQDVMSQLIISVHAPDEPRGLDHFEAICTANGLSAPEIGYPG